MGERINAYRSLHAFVARTPLGPECPTYTLRHRLDALWRTGRMPVGINSVQPADAVSDDQPDYANLESKIALRMTISPSRSVIDFHCDGSYATNTVQIALNDNYQGGRLCFYTTENGGFGLENNLECTNNRQTGSITWHQRSVLHGVTQMTAGVRKSLFVVDMSNNVGQEGVVQVGLSEVLSFLRSELNAIVPASAKRNVPASA